MLYSTYFSVQPRTKGVRQDVGLAEKLASLLSLNPDDVRALLSYHSIQLPQIQNRTCGIESLFYRTMDGSCNNLKNPCWGKTDEPYQRWLPPSYANGNIALFLEDSKLLTLGNEFSLSKGIRISRLIYHI